MKNRHFKMTTTQLAQICGVSQGTVDRALHGRAGISPKTKERILQVAQEYGYRPNIHARSLSGGASMLVGIVVFDLYNDYFSELVMELEARLRAEGYCAVVLFSHKDPALEKECLEQLYFAGVDGIVLCPAGKGKTFSAFLQSFGIPVLTVGNQVDGIPFVGVDDKAAMADAAHAVLARGYEQFLYVCAPVKNKVNASAQELRLEGFQSAVRGKAEYQVLFDPREVANQVRRGKRTAVLCGSDYFALRLLGLRRETGIGLMGFDNSSILERCGIPLDSVAYDSAAAAQAAMDLLLGRRSPVSVLVAHKIVRRGSV